MKNEELKKEYFIERPEVLMFLFDEFCSGYSDGKCRFSPKSICCLNCKRLEKCYREIIEDPLQWPKCIFTETATACGFLFFYKSELVEQIIEREEKKRNEETDTM